MFTIRTLTESTSTSDPAAALRSAMLFAAQGRKASFHQFGGRTLSLRDLSAIAGMTAFLGSPAPRMKLNVTAQMLGLT